MIRCSELNRVTSAAEVWPAGVCAQVAARRAWEKQKEVERRNAAQVRFELFRIVSNCFEFQLTEKLEALQGRIPSAGSNEHRQAALRTQLNKKLDEKGKARERKVVEKEGRK